MKTSVLRSLLSIAAFYQAVLGLVPSPPRPPPLELTDEEAASLLDTADPLTGNGTFENFIDHKNPGLGTFSQAFWYNATFWKGPGSPVRAHIESLCRLAIKTLRSCSSHPEKVQQHLTGGI